MMNESLCAHILREKKKIRSLDFVTEGREPTLSTRLYIEDLITWERAGLSFRNTNAPWSAPELCVCCSVGISTLDVQYDGVNMRLWDSLTSARVVYSRFLLLLRMRSDFLRFS